MPEPLAYFMTFTCYGCRLHGDDPYTVDRRHSTVNGPHLAPDEGYRRAAAGAMKQAAYVLDEARRKIVLASIREVCQHREWTLLAAHVRSNHVHLLVQAVLQTPEQAMAAFKAYASRALNTAKGRCTAC